MDDKDKIIEEVKKHIHKIREESPTLNDKDFKIALGKVLVELKVAQKEGTDGVLKDILL